VLVEVHAYEFEHLVKRLFEAIGLKSWVAQASRDDGVDAVRAATRPIDNAPHEWGCGWRSPRRDAERRLK
jgi:hypothetical protein